MAQGVELFWWFLVAHAVSDWALQSPWMAEQKAKVRLVMIIHCLIYTGALSAVLAWYGLPYGPYVLGFFVTHYVIDTGKCRILANKPMCDIDDVRRAWRYVWIDQALHLWVIIMVAARTTLMAWGT